MEQTLGLLDASSKLYTQTANTNLHLVHQGIWDNIIGKFILSYFFISPKIAQAVQCQIILVPLKFASFKRLFFFF